MRTGPFLPGIRHLAPRGALQDTGPVPTHRATPATAQGRARQYRAASYREVWLMRKLETPRHNGAEQLENASKVL